MPHPPPPILKCGDRIGRFVLERELGRGGFGAVWQARDPELGRAVAIKVIQAASETNANGIDTRVGEARRVAQLNHPAIVTIHDVFRDGDRLCIVMELMTGGSLAAQMPSFRMRHDDAVVLAARVAEGLHHAHLQGVIHRDVKPQNILLDARGFPHLADFGLATSEAEQLNEAAVTLGTVGYIAPEVARGGGQYADPRSDIYSLGVVLYQLLTGRLPYLADDARQYLRQTVERDPRPLRTIDDSIPPALEQIVLKCLARDVTRRYSTARDLANDLNALHSGVVIEPHSVDRLPSGPTIIATTTLPESRITRRATAVLKRFSGSRLGTIAGIGMAGMLLAAAFGLGWVQFGPGRNRAGRPAPGNSASADVDAPLDSEFDDLRQPGGEWLTLLRKKPPVLLNFDDPAPGILEHDAAAGLLRVSSEGIHLFELGRTSTGELSLQAMITQPAWVGGIGLFFGFQEDPDRSFVKRFQVVQLQKESVNGLDRLVLMHVAMELDEQGVLRRSNAVAIGRGFALPVRPVVLELSIRNNRVSVRRGEELEWSKTDPLVPDVPTSDYHGRFGIVVSSASATVQNVRVQVPTTNNEGEP